MFDRRNPLTPDLLRKKKMEFKKHEDYLATHLPDMIYALATGTKEAPEYFYVGVTDNQEKRWADHLAGMNNQTHMKYAYIHAREVGVENVFMVILDPTSEFTEADWIGILTEQGHVLTNAVGGNGKRRKKELKDIAAAMRPKLSEKAKATAKKANSLKLVKSKP